MSNKEMDEKKLLRKKFLAVRGAIVKGQRAEKSKVICERLYALICRRRAKTVFLYAAFKGEVDLFPLANRLWQEDFCVCFPRCLPKKKSMDFWQVRSADELVVGAFGICEPNVAFCVPAPVPDLLIVPGISFDKQGFRLGYGGGFYDRYLADKTPPFCVAAAFFCQITENLPHEVWDKSVQALVTEKNEIMF